MTLLNQTIGRVLTDVQQAPVPSHIGTGKAPEPSGTAQDAARAPGNLKNDPVTLDTYGLNLFADPALEAMVRACREFERRFRAGAAPCWLALLGTSDTGKTHVAERIWRRLAPRCGWSDVTYSRAKIFWPALIGELRDGESRAFYRDLMRWPLLLLDDIGSERDNSGFAAEQLYTLLGCRARRWTILTSNRTLNQIAALDVRVANRFIRDGNLLCEVKTIGYSTRIK
mgnify:CR=1 FL=1